MPSWWRPEYQKAADLPATPAAPAAPQPPPPPPQPQTQPPVPAAPPAQARTMVLPTAPAAPPAAVLTVTAGPDTGFKFRVKPGAPTTIGRGPDNDIVVDDLPRRGATLTSSFATACTS